jgi:hypothetical protein
LDIGVASTVLCLSAANCTPLTSCNAGAFGGSHQEDYPLVAFFARNRTAEKIVLAAADADLGVRNGPGGCLVAYAQDVRTFRKFAAAALETHL